MAGVPAGMVLLAAGALWVGGAGMGGWATTQELAGWLMLVLMVATVAGIVTAAMRRAGLALAYLVGAVAMLVGVVGTVQVGGGGGVAWACLFVAWTMMWGVAARVLVPWGPGVSVGLPAALAGLCLASPVAAMPLVHAAAHWGGAGAGSLVWQGRVVEVVRHACPFLAVLDVMPAGGGGVRSNWATLPGMYKWSGLGQEVPMLLPNVWVCVGIYAGVAGVLLGVSVWRGRRASA